MYKETSGFSNGHLQYYAELCKTAVYFGSDINVFQKGLISQQTVISDTHSLNIS